MIFYFVIKLATMKYIFCSLLTLLALAATSNAQNTASTNSSNTTASKGNFDMAAARQAIEAANQQLGKAMASGDSTGIVALYHSQAVLYPPNMLAGTRHTMGSMAKAIPGMGIKTVTLKTSEVEGDNNMLVESGTYEMGDGSKAVDKGKYLVVWKMEDGKWKLYRDIWNSDMATGH